MDGSVLPRAFSLLGDVRNPAADQAIVESLPELSAVQRVAALEILLTRSSPWAIARLADQYHDYDESLRSLLLERVVALSSGLKIAIVSSNLQSRINAITMIVHGQCLENAPLVAEAFRSTCEKTRTVAAKGLRRLVQQQLAAADHSHTDGISRRDVPSDLQEAVSLSIRRGIVDSFPDILTLLLRLGTPIEMVVVELARDRRTTMLDHLCELTKSSTDPFVAALTLRMLAHQELAKRIGACAIENRNPSFLNGLIAGASELFDAQIRLGCRHLGSADWLRHLLDEVLVCDSKCASNGVELVVSIATTKELMAQVLPDMIGSSRPELRQATVRALARDKSDIATRWIALAAVRYVDESGRLALSEWRKRQVRSGRTSTLSYGPESVGSQMFERCWRQHLSIDDQTLSSMGDPKANNELHASIRARLSSIDPVDRARALRLCGALRLEKGMELIIQRLAQDADAIVRGLAVQMLARQPGESSARLLRARVADADERVQSNSIDALERLNLSDRIQWIYPKLSSPNSRIRASCVRSLLREGVAEAGEVLIDMLEHHAPSHRISALWVVETLGLRSIGDRVSRLASDDPDPIVRRKANRTCRILAAKSQDRSTVLGKQRFIDSPRGVASSFYQGAVSK